MTMVMHIGRHRAARSEHLLRMSFIGPIDRRDLEILRRVMAEMIADRVGCYLLADMTGCTGLMADARKYMAEWSKSGSELVSGTAVYGISFTIRTLVNLSLSAIQFLGRDQGLVVMVQDEDEGLRWIAARKAARE